jgi:hypothetical protein
VAKSRVPKPPGRVAARLKSERVQEPESRPPAGAPRLTSEPVEEPAAPPEAKAGGGPLRLARRRNRDHGR